MNKWTGLGRLTADIDLRYTQNQTAFGRFTLAVPRMKKEDGADFISCKVWGKRAETMAKYIKKGHKVCIAGRIETGSYLKGEQKIYTTDIVVEDFVFCESRSQQDDQPQYSEEFIPVSHDHDPDLPF